MAAAIIQARLGSSRMPKKVLKRLPNGKSVLTTIIQSCTNAETITDIIVACPATQENVDLFREVLHIGAILWTGEEDDVLKRIYDAATDCTDAKTIVRLTSDCPMISPLTIDECVIKHGKNKVDFTYNSYDEVKGDVVSKLWADGQDVEVMTYSALKEAHLNATDKYDREHVTSYIRKSDKFTKLFVHPPDGEYRSLDTIEDYEWICKEMIK